MLISMYLVALCSISPSYLGGPAPSCTANERRWFKAAHSVLLAPPAGPSTPIRIDIAWTPCHAPRNNRDSSLVTIAADSMSTDPGLTECEFFCDITTG